jgi:hypothetical protein
VTSKTRHQRFPEQVVNFITRRLQTRYSCLCLRTTRDRFARFPGSKVLAPDLSDFQATSNFTAHQLRSPPLSKAARSPNPRRWSCSRWPASLPPDIAQSREGRQVRAARYRCNPSPVVHPSAQGQQNPQSNDSGERSVQKAIGLTCSIGRRTSLKALCRYHLQLMYSYI